MTQKHRNWLEEFTERYGVPAPKYHEWDGDKWVFTYTVPVESGGVKEKSFDATKSLAPGSRATSNIELLVIEAELAAEGKELGNPAVPVGNAQKEIMTRLEQEGLEPAWESCTKVPYPPQPEGEK